MMAIGYTERLREAMRQRARARLPHLEFLITAVVVGVLGFIAWAVADAPPSEPEYHFRREAGAITRASAFFLAAAAFCSLIALTVTFMRREAAAFLWLVFSAGFAFLAADELLQFHEQFGDMMKNVASGPLRNWNDAAVIVYGLLALPILAILLPNLVRYRMVLELFAAAFVAYALHTLIDSTQHPPTTLSVISEESAKLFTGAFLALAALAGLLGVFWNKDHPINEAHAALADRLKPR